MESQEKELIKRLVEENRAKAEAIGKASALIRVLQNTVQEYEILLASRAEIISQQVREIARLNQELAQNRGVKYTLHETSYCTPKPTSKSRFRPPKESQQRAPTQGSSSSWHSGGRGVREKEKEYRSVKTKLEYFREQRVKSQHY